MKWLTSSQAKLLLKKHWYNDITSSWGPSPLKIFINQFKDPLTIILIWACWFSFIFWEEIESIVIWIVILINSFIWFYQEFKAEKWVEALRKMISHKIKVLRDWVFIQIDSKLLVPWDIIELHEWDKIPADCNIIESNEFKINESMLTGESIFVFKEKWKIFMWTIVVKWKALVEIQKTWMQTKFWEIAELTTKTKEQKSPIQKEIESIWRNVWIFVLIITGIIFLFSLIKNWIKADKLLESLLYAISIAVAAVPEWLNTTMIIVMTIAATSLASKNALVKKLSSVWSLWATTVICTDKTWTLTKNEMTVSKISTISKFWSIGIWIKQESFLWNIQIKDDKEFEILSKIWVLCNDSSLEIKDWKTKIIWDPTEWCLLILADKYWIQRDKLIEENTFYKTLSFDSQRKMMTSIYENNWKVRAYSKWAPESILKICSHIQENWKVRKINENDILKINQSIDSYQKNALRILAFAYRDLEKLDKKHYNIKNTEGNMIFTWIIWMIDPPREEVKSAIETTKKAWIKVIMITWDAPQTAKAIALNIWLIEEGNYIIINWDDVIKMKDSELLKILFDKKIPVFARINPVSKRKIVQLLQIAWEKVAVTWDWVNDAPALKKADIWVAMWIAWTDVAKESSDLILLDDSFASLEIAIREGRRIYENMKKFIYYIFSTNIWELVLIIWALFLWLKNPLTPVLILSLNLLTDIFPALALGVEPISEDIICKKPKDYWDKFFNKSFTYEILFSWALIWIISLLIFIYHLDISYSYAISTTFASIALMQITNSYNSKSRTLSMFSNKLQHNMYLYWSSLIWLILTLFIVQTNIWNNIFLTTKLDINTWLIVGLISFIIVVVEELRKIILGYNKKIM